jgi:hypothetical protein
MEIIIQSNEVAAVRGAATGAWTRKNRSGNRRRNRLADAALWCAIS